MTKRLIFICSLGIIASFVTATAGEIEISESIEGKTLDAGTTFTIIWRGADDLSPYVKIDLLDADGRRVRKISGGTPSNKVYKWDIPSELAAGDYRIKVFSNDLSSEGTSEVFHIRAARRIEKPVENTPPPVVDINQKNQAASRNPKPKEEKKKIYADEPKPVNAKPDATHQGHAVMPVVTFDDNKLEELIREMIEKKAPATIFSSDFRKIKELNVRGAGIAKISGMEYFDSLVTLDLGENTITDISRLKYLTKLRILKLDQNWIEDLTPLVENEFIVEGVLVDLSGNPIDCILQKENITVLKKRGVKLTIDCP